MKNVLIAYNSPNGSTAEVVNFISKELTALGHQVHTDTLANVNAIDASQTNEMPALSLYDAVIIAAPINGMKWRPEALNFVTAHQAELNSKLVVYVTLALLVEQGRPMWRKAVQNAFNQASAIVPPAATGIFGGSADGSLPAFMRWVFGLPKDMPKDNRNWSKIEAFSRKIHQLLS